MKERDGSTDESPLSLKPVESAESRLACGDPPSSSYHRLDDDDFNVLPMYPV
jgi:hypothetical protein